MDTCDGFLSSQSVWDRVMTNVNVCTVYSLMFAAVLFSPLIEINLENKTNI